MYEQKNNDEKRPLILVTNDDGYDAPGILALAKEAQNYGDVVIIAPKQYQSAMGRAITLRKPMTVDETYLGGNQDQTSIRAFIVDGTPASCVIMGLETILNRTPDLVVSGINNGENLAATATMSGTLGAAIEAATYGIPAIAVSLQRPVMYPRDQVDFTTAAKITGGLIEESLKNSGKYGLVNVNIPFDATETTETVDTFQSKQKLHIPKVTQKEGAYFIDLGRDYTKLEPNSDADVVLNQKKVSVMNMDYVFQIK
ncbi:5'/3'-nucleotidase SurE [Candidatus Woesearchaeota archaeon]|jgi:5'-nucleotidase|nr:5'/3'-nucleotidase SurE [Candidatus Woesearchaeota archaeon]